MKKSISRKRVLAWAAVFFAVLGFMYAQSVKIRVTVKNANVRAEADVSSQVVSSPPLGSVLEVVNKNLPWYEVKVKTSMGVEVTGFIHEMYVEEIAAEKEIEAEKPEPEKETVKPPEKIRVKQAPQVQRIELEPESEDKAAFSKGGFSLLGGIASGSFLSDSTSYSNNWSWMFLEDVQEQGTINHQTGSPMGFGAAFHYLFIGGLGIQVKADINSQEKIQDDLSTYNQTWSWTSGRGPYEREGEWNVNGSLSMSAFSLNLIYLLQQSPMFQPFFSAGVSYFSGSSEIDTMMGYGYISWFSDDYSTQYIDNITLPVSAEADLSGIGFNVGGGLNLMFTRNVGLTVNAAYFIKSPVTGEWTVKAGRYDLNNFTNYYTEVDSEEAAEIAGMLDEFEINPSFFKIQGGITIGF